MIICRDAPSWAALHYLCRQLSHPLPLAFHFLAGWRRSLPSAGHEGCSRSLQAMKQI